MRTGQAVRMEGSAAKRQQRQKARDTFCVQGDIQRNRIQPTAEFQGMLSEDAQPPWPGRQAFPGEDAGGTPAPRTAAAEIAIL
jgi:hypothetical protein